MSDGRDYLRDMWTRNTTNEGMVNSLEEFKVRSSSFDEVQKSDMDYMPNQKLHRNVSFAKSAVRIFGFGAFWLSVDVAATLLILAEVIGIYEELV